MWCFGGGLFDGKVRFTQGDMLDVLRGVPDNHFDSVVCDPPYHLTSVVKRFGAENAAPAQFGTDGAYARASKGFMGKTWDGGDVAFRVEVWAEVWRVLKPGGYVLAFSGTRTYHRMAVAIEDAGFEIRDQIQWLYGSGFPKSHNLGDEWEGYGTALKPANEPICVARKPLEGTVAQNVLKWGVGAMNIDGCRVSGEPWKAHRATGLASVKFFTEGDAPEIDKESHALGRWPANILHDGSDEVLAGFPDSAGQLAPVGPQHGPRLSVNTYGDYGPREDFQPRNDSGSAARFFYTAKASRTERAGSTHPTVKPISLMRYLVRLVTPPGGFVLDPFAGSGTTGEAAYLEGARAFLIDLSEDTLRDLKARSERCVE